MTIRHLKTFVLVCEHGSISKAAEMLFVAQPSVSQTIKELEDYYNVVLFHRQGKKLVITEDGKRLLEKAKEVLSSFTDFEDTAKHVDISPVINVGLSITFGQKVLPTFIHEVGKIIPNAEPYIYVDKTKGIEEKILTGDIDFAIVEGFVSSKDIKVIQISKDRLLCVSGLEYPIKDHIKLEEIINHKLLVREKGSGSRKILDNALLQRGIKIIKPRMESTSNSVIISMVINNNGIAILPEAIVKDLIANKQIREIKLDTVIERPLFLICHKNKKFNKTARIAYDLCEKMLKNI